MGRLRRYIYQRRLRKYNASLERVYDLRVALGGIDYSVHPDVYDEVMADLLHERQLAQSLANKLGA